jgi:hypothetical protein
MAQLLAAMTSPLHCKLRHNGLLNGIVINLTFANLTPSP